MRVSQKIIKLLNDTPNLKAGEVASKLKISPAKVYQTLSYLYKTNKVKRVNQKYSVQFELPMTSIPMAIDEAVKIPTARVEQEIDKKLHREVYALRNELNDLKADHSELLMAYFDTKAIVKYLEEKLSIK